MITKRISTHLFRIQLLGLGLFAALAMSPSLAATQSQMQQRYEEFNAAILSGEQRLPFFLDSEITSVSSEASVRFVLDDVPFRQFVDRMGRIGEWCEFIPLHLNIKACGHFRRESASYLQFYAGIKGYLAPDKAHVLQLSFNASLDNGVFLAKLFAEDGPLDSSNISFEFRAIPIENGGQDAVYVEFDLSSVPGLASSLAKVYLATVARKKVGFTELGTSWRGTPIYVKGQRGAAERNIVRYLLAVETYFATLEVPEQQRHQQRLENWFDATEKYRRQLYELSRSEYLSNKRRERKNQAILQQALDAGVEPVFVPQDRSK